MNESTMVVLIDAELPDEQAEAIRRLSPRIQLTYTPPGESALPADTLKQAEVLYTTHPKFDPQEAPRLRWVQLNTAAANQITDKPIASSGVPIATVSGAYSVTVAECAMAILLALTRRIPLAYRQQMDHQWKDVPLRGEDLYGKTMGIIGYGSIGRQIARISQAVGMTVLACKRSPEIKQDDAFLIPGTGDPEGKIPEAWYGPDQIVEMMRRTNVAMITLPLTHHTRGLIGQRELEALPPRSYLINVGRGAVIDENALIGCLRSGHLAGAALDVFTEEPLPPESPFWDLPNVLVTPHIGSWTTAQSTWAAQVFIENLSRDLRGEPLFNVVDMERMY